MEGYCFFSYFFFVYFAGFVCLINANERQDRCVRGGGSTVSDGSVGKRTNNSLFNFNWTKNLFFLSWAWTTRLLGDEAKPTGVSSNWDRSDFGLLPLLPSFLLKSPIVIALEFNGNSFIIQLASTGRMTPCRLHLRLLLYLFFIHFVSYKSTMLQFIHKSQLSQCVGRFASRSRQNNGPMHIQQWLPQLRMLRSRFYQETWYFGTMKFQHYSQASRKFFCFAFFFFRVVLLWARFCSIPFGRECRTERKCCVNKFIQTIS